MQNKSVIIDKQKSFVVYTVIEYIGYQGVLTSGILMGKLSLIPLMFQTDGAPCKNRHAVSDIIRNALDVFCRHIYHCSSCLMGGNIT